MLSEWSAAPDVADVHMNAQFSQTFGALILYSPIK